MTTYHGLRYYLSEQPSIVGFRWSHTQSWGSTWSFLFSSIALYVSAAAVLHLLLLILFRHRRPSRWVRSPQRTLSLWPSSPPLSSPELYSPPPPRSATRGGCGDAPAPQPSSGCSASPWGLAPPAASSSGPTFTTSRVSSTRCGHSSPFSGIGSYPSSSCSTTPS
ncbi:UNVERIFIED_CONTAM: Elongation of fatty acids protein 3-like [Sesamum radiatum]|uniref:Elongation of fatty acids protein 3-like n=1 Tax=Sesamum radiatum TaxID=300843 RepID=A0AAW2RE34_SESRA